jgi:glycosyltransferase involved in cell wall biosynthesis
VNNKLIVFGITMAAGGIENLMHYFLMDCAEKKKFSEIIIVTSYRTIAFEEEYEHLGINIIHICSWKRGRAYKKDVLSIISDLEPGDLIYVNLSTYCNWRLLSMLKKNKCKIIIHGHNAHVANIAKKIIHLIGRNKYKKIGYKIAVSEECSKFMFGGAHDAIIENGIDSNKYCFNIKNREESRAQLSIASKKIVIGCVGRISKEKNQLYLVKLSKKYKEIEFLFLGDFMNEKYKKSILASASTNCMFIGSKNDVERYLSGMDALVIPSKREAFPLAAIEALTNGLPVFFSEELKGKIPSSINLNENCFFLEDDSFNLRTIELSHLNRDSNQISKKYEYDIAVFLDKLYNFLDNEVYYGN